MEKMVDARGMACPLPVVNAKKAAESLHPGDTLIVRVDNEIAVQNLQRFAQHMGFAAVSEKQGDTEFTVTMHIGGDAKAGPETACAVDARKKGMLVVLSANTMGTGEEKLGKALMKAFVFALTKQDVLPETILCYNTGAYLTTEGADTLEDLKHGTDLFKFNGQICRFELFEQHVRNLAWFYIVLIHNKLLSLPRRHVHSFR